MNVFYSTIAPQRTVDVALPTGLGLYSGKTKAALEAEHGPLDLISTDEAYAHTDAQYTTAPQEIDIERFTEWLECLPPCKWKRVGNGEAFHVSERISGSIVTWCVRLGDRYFSLNATDRLSAEEASTICRRAA